MKQVDDAFMKANPGIVIKRVHQPFNSYFTLLRTAVATRKGPDIFENYARPLLFDYYAGLTSARQVPDAAAEEGPARLELRELVAEPERHALRDAVDGPGHPLLLQQGALQEGRPRSEQASDDVGAVPRSL